jgi:hypothetical protein
MTAVIDAAAIDAAAIDAAATVAVEEAGEPNEYKDG